MIWDDNDKINSRDQTKYYVWFKQHWMKAQWMFGKKGLQYIWSRVCVYSVCKHKEVIVF